MHPQAVMIGKGRETQIAPIDRQFGSKTVGQRAIAIFAGPVMNFILAFVLFGVYFQMAGVPMEKPDRLLIGNVGENMPASQTDIQVGDTIDSINGVKIGTDSNKMVELIQKSANIPLTFTVIRNGQPLTFKITPVLDSKEKVGKIGISAAPPTRPITFLETFKYSGIAMKNMTITIFEGFKNLIIGNFKLDDLGGPVRTAQVTSQIAERGLTELTSWVALLSLYLGIFNLLPIPALDGSRLLFLGLEAVRGRPVDPNRESMVHFIGFAMLMLLMLAVTYNDILRGRPLRDRDVLAWAGDVIRGSSWTMSGTCSPGWPRPAPSGTLAAKGLLVTLSVRRAVSALAVGAALVLAGCGGPAGPDRAAVVDGQVISNLAAVGHGPGQLHGPRTAAGEADPHGHPDRAGPAAGGARTTSTTSGSRSPTRSRCRTPRGAASPTQADSTLEIIKLASAISAAQSNGRLTEADAAELTRPSCRR